MTSHDDIDIICDLAKELDEFGCNNRVSADGGDYCNQMCGLAGRTEDELREFFEK